MDSEESSWIFDSLLTFLAGPLWTAPLQSFVEEKSLIFEPNIVDCKDYHAIYEEFKNLVDFMLASLMEELEITPEQFQAACSKGNKVLRECDHKLFEQIWAANDYDLFKRMMIQKNIELQMEALELIEQKYGMTPDSFLLENEKEPTSSTQKTTKQKELDGSPKKTTKISREELVENNIQTDKNMLSHHKDISGEKNETRKITSAEVKSRQEYLRAQRDRIVQKNKQLRKQQLNNDGQLNSKRPKTAKAVQKLLDGGTVDEVTKLNNLQMRKMLAERLKREVVDKAQ